MRDETGLSELEAEQLGLCTYRQLRARGFDDNAIQRRLGSGRLKRVRRGVYVNPSVPTTFEQELLAAVLAAGKTGFGTHESAGKMWEIPIPIFVPLEVTTILERQPRLPGVRMHRSGLLKDPDITELRGVPVSSPERTLCDLSSRLDEKTLGLAIDDVMRRRLASYGRIYRLAERLPSAPGRSQKKMLRVLERRGPEADLRESTLEDFVWEALRRYNIPLPVPQHEVIVAGRIRRIDQCYPRVKLAIEAKGFAFHGMRSRFDDDALRGNELLLAGFRVLEFTSAFDDWTIASHVAQALSVPVPPRPPHVLTYDAWKRLCSSPTEATGNGTNGR
jgi:hypothetical protein